jgi:cyanate lyase
MMMDLFDIADELADYLHDEGKTFADVTDELERQVNITLELMRQDDAEQAEDVSVFSEPFLEEDDDGNIHEV